MSFNFPDPSVQQTITNPATGVTYQWESSLNKWIIVAKPVEYATTLDERLSALENIFASISFSSLETEVDQNEEQLQAMSTALFSAQAKIESLQNLDIQNALSELSQARQDIIELKSKVLSLEQQVNLNLE